MRAERLLTTVAAVAGVVALVPAVASTLAVFTGTAGPATSSFSAMRIFPAARTVVAQGIGDASGGSGESDQSNPGAYVGGGSITTAGMSTTWSTARYFELELDGGMPAGLPVTAASVSLTYADTRSQNDGGGACWYLELRDRGTDAVLGTYGSPSAPRDCEDTTTLATTATSVTAEVPTTDVANGLKARFYVRHTRNNTAMRIDAATATVTTATGTWTLRPVEGNLRVNGVDAPATWYLGAAGDGAWYQSASTWPSAYSTSRYVELRVPVTLPAGAVVTAGQLLHDWRPSGSASTFCYRYQIYAGTTLIASNGSGDASCRSTTTFKADALALPALSASQSAAITAAGNLDVRVFVRSSAAVRSQHDRVAVALTYHLV